MESSSDTKNVEGQLGVIRGQIITDSRLELKLGEWSLPPMPKRSDRGNSRSNPYG